MPKAAFSEGARHRREEPRPAGPEESVVIGSPLEAEACRAAGRSLHFPRGARESRTKRKIGLAKIIAAEIEPDVLPLSERIQ